MNSLRQTLIIVASILGGFLLAFVWIADPWDLHSLDERWRSVSPDYGHDHAREAASNGQLWTCGMHPQVIQEEPGTCPICHMDLTPLQNESESGTGDVQGPGGTVASEVEIWTCPMHPEIIRDEPGRCPKCSMDLVSKRIDAAPAIASAVVRIDPSVVQNMNVRTERVARRDLRHPIRTVGYLEFDQERMVTVTTKYSGWIEAVDVNYVGEPVRQGQTLFEIYSPELVQTQQELLSAQDFARRMAEAPLETRRRAEALVEASRTRLRYWDIDAGQIAELERTGKVFRTLKVAAPASGVVMKRAPGLEGMGVRPGQEIFHIANLSTLWLTIEVFEGQVAWVREGTPAEITFTYFPGETFHGTVRFIEPEFSEITRTLRVKVAVPNRNGRLRPGMYATVVFEPEAVSNALAISSQAILRTGRRNVAVVRLEDGGFSPREVTLGYEGEGYVEILGGLQDGEEVVTSAQFLLDSESSLRAAIQKMVSERTSAAPSSRPGAMDHSSHDHGSMDHGSDDHGSDDHGSMDHSSHDHGSMDHGSHDHGSMDHGSQEDHGSMDHGSQNHDSTVHARDPDHSSTDPASMPMDHGSHDHGNHTQGSMTHDPHISGSVDQGEAGDDEHDPAHHGGH